MNRRGFLRGTVSVMAVAAVLKFAPPKPEYIRKVFHVEGSNPSYAEALARSMILTREKVTANVLNRGFSL